jgi:hypothetical protein
MRTRRAWLSISSRPIESHPAPRAARASSAAVSISGQAEQRPQLELEPGVGAVALELAQDSGQRVLAVREPARGSASLIGQRVELFARTGHRPR